MPIAYDFCDVLSIVMTTTWPTGNGYVLTVVGRGISQGIAHTTAKVRPKARERIKDIINTAIVDNYGGGGYPKGRSGGWGNGGANSFSYGYDTAYADQPQGNLCLVFERGGSDLTAESVRDADHDLSIPIVAADAELIEAPWNFPVKYVKTLKKKKKVSPTMIDFGKSEVETEQTIKEFAENEVDVSPEPRQPPPTADAGLIIYPMEQTFGVVELHSEPRAPVYCTINSSVVVLSSHSFVRS